MKKRTGEEGWVLMDTLTALFLSAVLLVALGSLLARTVEASLRLRQRTERLIELWNAAIVPPGEADEPH